MLQLKTSNNQIVSLYFYDNKKQTTIVSSSCHLQANVNHSSQTKHLWLIIVHNQLVLSIYLFQLVPKEDVFFLPR